MTDYNFEGLITVSDYAALKNIMGDDVKSEQGVRTLIRQYEAAVEAKKDTKNFGFQPVRVFDNVVLIKITDPKVEKFRNKLLEFAKANKPDKK